MGLLDKLFGKSETAEGKKAPEKPTADREGDGLVYKMVREHVAQSTEALVLRALDAISAARVSETLGAFVDRPSAETGDIIRYPNPPMMDVLDGIQPGRCNEHSHEPGHDEEGGWRIARE